MDSNAYYIINKKTFGLYDCIQSYNDLETAKQQAKMISEQLNITTLIVKPVAKITSSTKWTIEDLN